MKGFSTIATPLTEVIKKNVGFLLEEKQEQTFKILREKLSYVHVLALPNLETAFEIECDAFGVGVGAVLKQDGKPIANFSEKLNGEA